MKWWENLCQKCGFCCFKKKLADEIWIIDFNNPCEYLDTESNLCFIYEKRFKICRECKKMTIFRALSGEFLPDNCGYVNFLRKKLFFKRIKK